MSKIYKPRDFEMPLLVAVYEETKGTTAPVKPDDVIPSVCLRMGLQDENACGIQESTNQPWIRRWLLSTVKGLRKSGEMDSPQRGSWCLTAKGIARAMAVQDHWPEQELRNQVAEEQPSEAVANKIMNGVVPQLQENLDLLAQSGNPELEQASKILQDKLEDMPEGEFDPQAWRDGLHEIGENTEETVAIEMVAETSNVVTHPDGSYSFEDAEPSTVTVNVPAHILVEQYRREQENEETMQDLNEKPATPEEIRAALDEPVSEDLLDSIVEMVKDLEKPQQTQDQAAEAAMESAMEMAAALEPKEKAIPSPIEAVMFGFANEAGWKVDGTLIDLAAVTPFVVEVLAENKPSNLTMCCVDAMISLKHDGYLEGSEKASGKASITEEGIAYADMLGDQFDVLDKATFKEGATTEPQTDEIVEPDPYEGEEGSNNDFILQVQAPEERLPDDVLLNDPYVKGQIVANADCFGKSFHPDVEECVPCIVRVECYQDMLFKLRDLAKKTPIRDLQAEALAKAEAEALTKKAKAQPKPKPVEPTLPPKDAHVGLESPDLHQDPDLEQALEELLKEDQATNTTSDTLTSVGGPKYARCYTITDAENRAYAGKEWAVAMRKINPAKNERKFYYASGISTGTAHVRWGRLDSNDQIPSAGGNQPQSMSFSDAMNKLRQKFHQKGYEYFPNTETTSGLNQDGEKENSSPTAPPSTQAAPQPSQSAKPGSGNLPPGTDSVRVLPFIVQNTGMTCKACGIEIAVGSEANAIIGVDDGFYHKPDCP